MGRFREKMYRFMYGRYGTDNLYNFLTWFTVFLIIAEMITVAIIPEGQIQAIVSLAFFAVVIVLFVWNISRTFSKNIAKRRRENERDLKLSRATKRFFSLNTSKGTKTMNRDDEYYIFRDCTRCASTLRLQRRVGRHKVKCPRCSHTFFVKAKKYRPRRF